MRDKPCFLDTNIWLYAFIKSEDNDKTAIADQLIKSHRILASSQVVNELCVNLIKKAKLSEPQIQELITSFYKKYSTVNLNKEIMVKASALREQYKFSFWDSMVVSAALFSDAGTLYTEDMHDSLIVEGKLRIVNPFKQ
ncbi:MAG: PIN domain-containing protein [Deltaproteobacteria bacterium]|nr:PIN domain-containing protein [Deltaproteobacteria bacterium]